MSKKDLLKEKAKGKLATSTAVKQSESRNLPAVSGAELKKLTMEIKSGLEEMNDIAEWWRDKKLRINELRELVIEKLIYVRENKKSLLGIRTFEDYLVNEIGLSKGYFYEQLQAYEVCAEYKKPKLFKEVDHKILVNIAREKDPERKKTLIENAKELSREDFKKEKQAIKVSPTDFLENKNNPQKNLKINALYSSSETPGYLAVSLLETFKKMHDESKKEDERSSIHNMIRGIAALSRTLNNSGYISNEDMNKIEMIQKTIT